MVEPSSAGREPPRNTPPTARDPLAALVAQCIDRMEDEGSAALEELCRAHPEHAPKLRAYIARLQRVGLVGEMPAPSELPERLGDFRILSLLGRGGMGVVYLAEQEALQRRVALKLVRPEHLFFPGARQRFRREIEAAARLQHPGIIPVHAAGEEHGVPFYAMEYVRGAALEEVLAVLAGSNVARLSGADLLRAVEDVVRRREQGATGGSGAGSLGRQLFAGTWAETVQRIARQVAVALQHAHEQGVLHRDVKPSNVMLTPEGRVLLLDFGLAAAEGSQRLTGSGSQPGSLAWMSPEQVRGDALDARTDVYSLGATLYELLALRSPFADATVDGTRQRILDGRAAPLRVLNPAVPRDAETVCLKAMDRDRERRYASAADLADDLGNALELRPVLARRPGAWLRSRRWAQRHPAAAVAGVLGALVLVGGPVGYGLVQGRAAATEQKLNEELGAANARLDDALTDLQGANGELERSLGEERRQRERSQRSFDRSLAAVDELLADVGSQDLVDVPQFERVRSRLLLRALDFYRALEADDPGNVDVRRERARTHRAIGDLLTELGRFDEARAAYEEAVPELRGLLDEHPDAPDLHHTYASCLSQLARRDFLEGRTDAARERWEESRAELEPLVAVPSPPEDGVCDLATVVGNLALLADAQGESEAALEQFRRAAALLEPLCARHPERTEYAILRASQLTNAATIASRTGRADAAEPLHRENWAALQALAQAEPWNRELRVQAVEAANNFGLLLLARSNRAEAEAVLRAGWDLARGLVREYPEEPDYGRRAGVIGINLVAELINEERCADAEPIVTACCRDMEALAARLPGDPQVLYSLAFATSAASAVHQALGQLDVAAGEAARGVELARATLEALHGDAGAGALLAVTLCQAADVAQAQGDPVHALALVEEALTLASGRPDVYYQAAETLARCRLAAHDGPLPDGTARDALVDDLTTRTLAVLRQAVEAGFNDTARLRDTTLHATAAFAPLRDLPEFQDIVRAAGG